MKKQILLTILTLVWSATGLANADLTTTIEARFIPSASSSKCNELIVGSENLVAFEKDGSVKTQLTIEARQDGTLKKTELLVNRRAFVPYFSSDKTPVEYEGGPQLVKAHPVQDYLPRGTHSKKWVLLGYQRPYARFLSSVSVQGGETFIVQTRESSPVSVPNADQISPIRTAELFINEDEAVLNVTQEFSMADPRVPLWYKQHADWARDLTCRFKIN